MAAPVERYYDQLALLRTACKADTVDTWTALPGIIQSYQPGAQTVTVQPTIKANVMASDGAASTVNRPILVDVPVQFPGGAGHTLTFPIAQGDECLVVFSSRCIDGWWQNGGVQPQLHPRTHDLSDGFAILGFRSKPRVLANVSTTSTQLRSDDGQSYVDFNASGKTLTLHSFATTILLDGGAGTVGIDAPNGVVVNGPMLACTGEIEAKFGTAAAVHLTTHEHTNVQPGGGESGPPVPGT